MPKIGSPGYHMLLTAVALLILGPLGAISAAYMNFSIGFFVGGQVLAGILGSMVTLPYGPEGKHGANYMQTMAASVAGMSAMAPLVQAMVWLGLPQPPVWQLILYFMSIGMFGVGLGMLYTPLLVDRLQLTYPSGLAVANILRALTDKALLRRSIARLGSSIATGFAISLGTAHNAVATAAGLSVSTFGGGLIVGARIAIPALVVALIGAGLTPYLVEIHWLQPGETYRRIGFILSLGAILGAASLDLLLILLQTFRRLTALRHTPAPPADDWKRVNFSRLSLWVIFWGSAVVVLGSLVLDQPVKYLLVAVALCFLFVLTNGIALGISDFNPISSAFVVSVFIMAAMGLGDPGVALLCAAVLAIATSEGGDMQQDRSTGWRLGTNRIIQFRYQMLGIVAGAVFAVGLAYLFMKAYPILRVDQLTPPKLPEFEKWQSSFTFKMVGALRGITTGQPYVITALWTGIGIGLLVEIARKLLKRSQRYRQFSEGSRKGRSTGFVVDAILLPSPYAFAFGGFVELKTVCWWTAGGLVSALSLFVRQPRDPAEGSASGGPLPEDMSTTSLAGGGFIAGDALGNLAIGVYGLLRTVL